LVLVNWPGRGCIENGGYIFVGYFWLGSEGFVGVVVGTKEVMT
jgi:hypothetical protein